MRTGAHEAGVIVVRRSSAMPEAALPIKLAVAGATMTRSVFCARSMWLILVSFVRSKRLDETGLRHRVERLRGVMNSAAAFF